MADKAPTPTLGKKQWWEYLVGPMMGGMGGGLVSPILGLFGMGPKQPQMPQMPEENPLMAQLARNEDRDRERRAAMNRYTEINKGGADVARALERIRSKWS